MRVIVGIACVFLALYVCLPIGRAQAAEKVIRGKVTYLSSGTVYASLGRDAGVKDSSLLSILSGKDTIAVLKVFAVSSKSSASVVVTSTRPIKVGDEIVASVSDDEPTHAESDSSASIASVPAPALQRLRERQIMAEPPMLDLHGRISAQYFTSLYGNSQYNLSQPGVVLNLRGAFRDVPVRMDMYMNLRMLSIGAGGPFSRRAINQSRIYGMSVSFDDGENLASLGRIIPTFAPSIGYIDGALFSRKFGGIVVGTTFGFQPAYSLRSLSADYKKLALFAQYHSPDRLSFSVSTAYARTYFHSRLDREAASVLLNASVTNSVYIYANSEVDLRRKSGSDFVLSPRLTSAYVNVSYRISNAFTVGLGGDASRPYYSFESIRLVPDSLLPDELRSGVSVSVSCYLPGGISFFNTYTPRNASNQPFGKEFTNYSSMSLTNVFSTGVNIRSNLSFSSNPYTKSTGYGVAVQRNFEQLVDVTLRFQQSGYTVKQTDLRNRSTTLGADAMIFLSNSLTFIATYDRLEGFGITSNSVFAELSVRF
ncbi:MAG: hypothetical protein HY961_15560 [Ignavibacteriae bacterium]|nr:hypothetical protein [Ignavibacteriota bacterium]